jgi:3-phosphoshikimate 1-carboxyvinyltransferase
MDVIVEGGEVMGEITPPPSKSYTHRAFIAASLSPSTKIGNPLISGDTVSTLNACLFIGARFMRDGYWFTFKGIEEINTSGYLNLRNSGTTLRLMMGLTSLSLSGKFAVLDGDDSLRKRPNLELAEAINRLGARVEGGKEFRAPVRIKGTVKGGDIVLSARSSQFVSSLLFTLSLARGNSEIRILSVKSKPYIDITLEVLENSGIYVGMEEQNGNIMYYINGDQRFKLRKFVVPADFSSTGYLIAAGLIGGEIEIKNAFPSRQGDEIIVDVVREMGGDVRWNRDEGIIRVRKSPLTGIDIDASNFPDLVPVLSVMAAFAEGETRIRGIEHLRIKEIDRVEGILRNLHSLGVEAKIDNGKNPTITVKGDGYRIFKGNVKSFGDHRMALAFSLFGIAGKVYVEGAEAVSVSYPGYFDTLRSLGVNVRRVR